MEENTNKDNNKAENTDNKLVEKEMNSDTNSDESIISDIIPEEVLEGIPIEDRGKLISMVKQTMISSVSRRSNPIAEKITPEHITTLIDNSSIADKRDREERNSERKYNVILIIIGLIFVSFLVVFLQKNVNLLITIITAILSFIGGFGFGKSQQ